MQRALILSEEEKISGEHILLEGVDWQDASGLQQIVEGSDVATPEIKPIAEATSINKSLQAVKDWGMSLEIKSMRSSSKL